MITNVLIAVVKGIIQLTLGILRHLKFVDGVKALEKLKEKQMKIIKLASIMLLLTNVAFAAPTYEERVAEAKRQNEAEIKRHHELMIQEKKIEVLGRLQLLGVNDTTINNNVESSSFATNKPHTKITQSN